jgi:hypothetical protein
MATVRSYSVLFADNAVTDVRAYDGADTAAKTDTDEGTLHIVKSTDLADVSNDDLLAILNHLATKAGTDKFETLPVRKDAIKRIAQSLVSLPLVGGAQTEPATPPAPTVDKEAEKAAKEAEKAAKAEAKAAAKAEKERLMAEAKAAKDAKVAEATEAAAKRKADAEAALATAQAVGAEEETTLKARLDALLALRTEALTKVYEQYPELKAKGKRKSPTGVVGGGRVGIIDVIKETLARTEGASVKELREILARTFPDRDADGMTATIRTQVAQLPKKLGKTMRKVTDEARGGAVYYLG